MLITVSRENFNKTATSVWEFVFLPGATELDRFKLELVSYSKYKKTKEPIRWRLVGRWSSGFPSTLDWTEVRLPKEVLDEVQEKIRTRVNFMLVRAGNVPLPISKIVEDSDG